MAVTLINVFSVPKGKEDEFVNWWQHVKATITKQPGSSGESFIGASSRTAHSTSLTSRLGEMKMCTESLRKERHPHEDKIGAVGR